MSGLIDPGDGAFDITPSDTVNLTIYTRGLYVGTVGDVKVDMLNGDTVIFVALAGGIIHPLQVRKVYATGTDATDIIGIP